jgi:hypothetical protein
VGRRACQSASLIAGSAMMCTGGGSVILESTDVVTILVTIFGQSADIPDLGGFCPEKAGV